MRAYLSLLLLAMLTLRAEDAPLRDSRGEPAAPEVAASFAGAGAATTIAFDGDSETAAVALLEARLPKLPMVPGKRWPILVWHHTPTTAALCQAMIERGIGPLWNPVATPDAVARYREPLAWFQERQVPVVILAQGWLQRAYHEPPHGLGCNHLPPARPSRARDDAMEPNRDFTCPAWMLQNPALDAHADNARRTALALRDAGIVPASIWLDFESGAYLRNGAENRDRLEAALAEARRCPRCREAAGDRLASLENYSQWMDEVRAATIRRGFVEPIRSVFPNLPTGNFFAHPVERQPPEADRFPAYGYAGSGMAVAQPRTYFTPGWGGAGDDQAKTDWNIFRYAVGQVSACARVLEPGEILVPWIGYLWGNAGALAKAKRQQPIASAAAYRELTIHLLLRGAETIALFAPEAFDAPLPKEYAYLPRHELGALFLNVVDVQAGYAAIVPYDDLIRRGRPLTYDLPGEDNRLDETAAVWSGVATDDEALIRTVAFGPEQTLSVALFGQTIKLPCRQQGQFYRVGRDGTVTPLP